MRVARPVFAAAVATTVSLSGSALGAVKPVCNLITDPAGNGSVSLIGPVATPNDDRLDIRSADIAASSSKDKVKKITAVIRLAKADGTALVPSGSRYTFYFKAPGGDNPLFLQYFTGNDLLSENYSYGYVDPVQGLTNIAGADGFIKNNEIHITAPLSGFDATGGALIKPGDKLTALEANTSIDALLAILYANTATTTGTYTVGTKSCVTPGK